MGLENGGRGVLKKDLCQKETALQLSGLQLPTTHWGLESPGNRDWHPSHHWWLKVGKAAGPFVEMVAC